MFLLLRFTLLGCLGIMGNLPSKYICVQILFCSCLQTGDARVKFFMFPHLWLDRWKKFGWWLININGEPASQTIWYGGHISKNVQGCKNLFLFVHIVVSTLCWVETISGMVEVNRWRQKQNKLTKLKRCDSTLKCISERLTGKDAITSWFKLKYYNYWLLTRFTFITR